MTIKVESFFHTTTNTVTHVVWEPDSRDCAVIDSVLDFDPASGRVDVQFAQRVIDFVQSCSLNTRYVLETHVHADHLSAAPYLKEKLGAPIMIGDGTRLVSQAFQKVFDLPSDSSETLCPQYFDRLLIDNDRLPLGSGEIRVLSTPGHTPGCITFVTGDAAFVGDTLFMPDYGTARSDFPGGDACTLFRSIRRILSLPENTRLFLCHDYKAPERDQFVWQTTVSEQRRNNIHINDAVTEAEFVRMREERDATLNMPALLLPSVQVNLHGGQLPPAANNGIQYLKIPLNQF